MRTHISPTLKYGLLAILLLTLSACGGSSSDDDGPGDNGYGGEESAASVSADNQGDIAMAARTGTEEAIIAYESPDVFLGATGVEIDSSQQIDDITLEILALAQVPTGMSQTIEGECGGNAEIHFEDDGAEVGYINYNNFCASSGQTPVTMDGRVDFEMTDSRYEIRYNNVQVTVGNETHTLNTTISCDMSGGGCTYQSNVTGSDGRTYRTENAQVSGSDASGYSVSMRVYDPDHGYVDLQAEGITLCDNGGIGSGNITVSDSEDTQLMIAFTSCDSMTVTLDGVSETFSQ